MSQPRRTIEHLLNQGTLPLEHADTAATHLEVFPTKRSWLMFFDKALLIIGAMALVLSLVFFIAYNWLHMGKMGKFALVEGALLVTIILYVGLSFRRRFRLIRQLLLLIASIITGSLLALFGQVYQTGADTWQLFFNWALLITPWVLIARLPVLWLLWLGLINTCLVRYIDTPNFFIIDYDYHDLLRIGALAVVNVVALNLWLTYTTGEHRPTIRAKIKASLHWSTYVVGVLSTYFITHLAVLSIFADISAAITLLTLLFWASWCGFMLWHFYQRQVDLLMLTYLCGSIIAVVMFWATELLADHLKASGMLLLALLLIAMSSISVAWLRRVADDDNKHQSRRPMQSRGDYE